MVDDHHLQAHFARSQDGVVRHGPTIDCNNQIDALVLQPPERQGTRTVALGNSVGHIKGQFDAQTAEPADQLRGAGGPIDVIVSKHRHGALPFSGIDQKTGGLVHIHKTGRIGKLYLQRRAQIGLATVRAHPTRGQGEGQGL